MVAVDGRKLEFGEYLVGKTDGQSTSEQARRDAGSARTRTRRRERDSITSCIHQFEGDQLPRGARDLAEAPRHVFDLVEPAFAGVLEDWSYQKYIGYFRST